MNLTEVLLELEYALLEGNEKHVHSLVDRVRQETNISDLTEELCTVAGCLCQGEYVNVLNQSTAAKLFGTNDVKETFPEIEIYITQRITALFSTTDNEHSVVQRHLILLIGVTCLQLFVQQNWTGPQLGVEGAPANFLPSFFRTGNQKKKLQEYSLAKLSIDGESAYSLAGLPTYLLLARLILVDNQHQLDPCKSSAVWAIRCLQTQQQLLVEHSNNMRTSIFNLIDTVNRNTDMLSLEKNRYLACQIHLELGYHCLHYHETVEAKDHFATALNSLQLKLELMGALGKRTKFQETDVSQLLLVVTNNQIGEGDQPFNKQSLESLPKDVAMDDDTLLEKVKYKNSESVPALPSLNALEQSVILAQCVVLQKSQAVERLTTEELLAYVECVLSEPTAWSVHALALLMRSRLEKGLSRKVERSMMQLQSLLDATDKVTPKVLHRQRLFHCLPIPPRWVVQKELADLLKSMGAVKSAVEIYQQLHMWEDVIVCYQVLGWHEKAETLVREQLKLKETVSLWCLLGDITKNASHYKKAWEFSGHRSSRAQRSLGLLHLRAQRFAECIPCFQKSLELNSLQEGIWFSLGCAGMATGDTDLAGKAFQRCVSLDSENSEAWNNLSHIFIKSGQKERAHRTLQEALKSSYENWHIWENFLVVSIDVGAFNDVIVAFHRLMELRDKYTDILILDCLVKAVNGGMLDNQGQSASNLRPKVLQLMGRMTSQVTNNSELWRLYSDLYLNGESMEDKEKGLHFLVKAHRVRTQSSNWETDVTTFKEMIDMTLTLTEVYVLVSQSKQNKAEAVQLLSSGKLNLKQLLAKSKKHHTDALTGEIRSELSQPVTKLESSLHQVVDLIAALKT